MFASPTSVSITISGAPRVTTECGRMVVAAGYYFGYWFSHRRA